MPSTPVYSITVPYVGFQFSVMSEWLLGRNDGAYLREAMVGSNLRDNILREYYYRTLSQLGFVDQSILYYRATALGSWGYFGACPPAYPKSLQRSIRLTRKSRCAMYGIDSNTDGGNGGDRNGEGYGGNNRDKIFGCGKNSGPGAVGVQLAASPTHLVLKLSKGTCSFRTRGPLGRRGGGQHGALLKKNGINNLRVISSLVG